MDDIHAPTNRLQHELANRLPQVFRRLPTTWRWGGSVLDLLGDGTGRAASTFQHAWNCRASRRRHKRCGINYRMLSIMPGLSEWSAQATRYLRPDRGLRRRRGDVEAAVDQSVDEGANQSRAVEHFSALPADICRQSIQMKDLTIEQHDRHLGPCLLVAWRTPPGGFRCELPFPHFRPLRHLPVRTPRLLRP